MLFTHRAFQQLPCATHRNIDPVTNMSSKYRASVCTILLQHAFLQCSAGRHCMCASSTCAAFVQAISSRGQHEREAVCLQHSTAYCNFRSQIMYKACVRYMAAVWLSRHDWCRVSLQKSGKTMSYAVCVRIPKVAVLARLPSSWGLLSHAPFRSVLTSHLVPIQTSK